MNGGPKATQVLWSNFLRSGALLEISLWKIAMEGISSASNLLTSKLGVYQAVYWRATCSIYPNFQWSSTHRCWLVYAGVLFCVASCLSVHCWTAYLEGFSSHIHVSPDLYNIYHLPSEYSSWSDLVELYLWCWLQCTRSQNSIGQAHIIDIPEHDDINIGASESCISIQLRSEVEFSGCEDLRHLPSMLLPNPFASHARPQYMNLFFKFFRSESDSFIPLSSSCHYRYHQIHARVNFSDHSGWPWRFSHVRTNLLGYACNLILIYNQNSYFYRCCHFSGVRFGLFTTVPTSHEIIVSVEWVLSRDTFTSLSRMTE